MSEKKKVGKRSSLKVILASLAGAFLLAVVVGILSAPAIIKQVVLPKISEIIGGELTAETIKVNAGQLSAELGDFALRGSDGEVVASAERVFIDIPFSLVLMQKLAVDAIELDRPTLNVEIDESGLLNLLQFVPKSESESPLTEIPEITVGRLLITEGSIAYEQRNLPELYALKVEPVSFELNDFSTVATSINPMRLSASTSAGEKLLWEGGLRFNPLGSEGTLVVENVQIPLHAPSYKPLIDLDVQQGRIDARFDYTFHPLGEVPEFRINGAKLSVADFSVAKLNEEVPFASFGLWEIGSVDVDVYKKSVAIESHLLKDGFLKAIYSEDGLDLLDLLNAPVFMMGKKATPATAQDADAEGLVGEMLTAVDEIVELFNQPWEIRAETANIESTVLELSDVTRKGKPFLRVSEITATAEGLSTNFSKKVPVALSARVADEGGVTLKGDIQLEPLSIQADASGQHLPLYFAGIYLDDLFGVQLTSGKARLDGVIAGSFTGKAGLGGEFAGSFQVDGLEAGYGEQGQLALSLSKLSGESVKASYPENQVALERFELTDASLIATGEVEDVKRIALQSNLSLESLLARTVTASLNDLSFGFQEMKLTAANVAPIEGETGFLVVDAISLDNVHAAELSLNNFAARILTSQTDEPLPVELTLEGVSITDAKGQLTNTIYGSQVTLNASEVAGRVEGVSSDPDKPASVSVEMLLNDSAKVAIDGQLTALNFKTLTDLSLKLDTMNLVPFSPAAGEIIGFPIEGGSLSLDSSLNITDSQLLGQNAIIIDQLKLGESTGSPNAIKAPVKLGVGLIQKNGVIDIKDFPIKGDLSDPQYSIIKVVLDQFALIMVNAAAKPFEMLGGLAGGVVKVSDNQVALKFSAGEVNLSDAEKKGLEDLASKLVDKPVAKLGIQGTYAPEDRDYLKQQDFRYELRKRHAEASGTSLETVKFQDIASTDRENLMRIWYAQAFPQKLAEETTVSDTDSEPVDAPAPEQSDSEAPKKQGFVLFRIFSGDDASPEPKEEVTTEPEAIPAVIDSELPIETIRAELLAQQQVSEDRLKALAVDRATRIRDYLLENELLPENRIELNEETESSKEPVALFSIR